ncbi:MAG: GlsB/YeaQ/YmgE family stress response membrane protein [Arenimonas sp.]|nr:GlsB/YeaQ/YmgE family stress response membrane protein [Arenimonas sp.]MBP6310588.1 GlsB/YeaQ/YmgE family stress response membrane protein [Arenimonas sp.]
MSWLWMIVIGFIVGLIARALKPGDDSMGIIMTSVLGIAGSLAAGLIGKSLGWYKDGDVVGFMAAVIGALVLLFIYGLLKKK